MIVSITTSTGRIIHVAPDNEPVFNHSEVIQMEGMNPETAELIALIKEIIPGGKVAKTEHYKPKKEEEQMALLNFNAAEEKEMGDFSPLPAADYVAAIVESEMVANSKGNGHYLKLKFEVIEGECASRTVFANLNLDNPNATAVEIARSELKSICAAVGKGNDTVNDSAELHDKPMMIKVVVVPRNDKPGEFSNNIKKYAPVGGGNAAAAAPKTSAKTATGAKRPWEH